MFYISYTMHQTQQLLNKTISAPMHSGLIAAFRVMITGIVLRDQVRSITEVLFSHSACGWRGAFSTLES